LEQPCRKHRQYLLSNNSQLTESQIFQLQDEQFATWFRTHVSTITNSLSLAKLLYVITEFLFTIYCCTLHTRFIKWKGVLLSHCLH